MARYHMPKMGMQTRKEKPRHRRRPPGNRDGERGPVGLADALFTSTQQRVLGLLFGQPGRSFFATELIALTGSGSGAVQRELKRLASSGLVTVTRIGNQKHYQANDTSPVFEELRSLIIKTVGLADPIRQVLAPLAETSSSRCCTAPYPRAPIRPAVTSICWSLLTSSRSRTSTRRSPR